MLGFNFNDSPTNAEGKYTILWSDGIEKNSLNNPLSNDMGFNIFRGN